MNGIEAIRHLERLDLGSLPRLVDISGIRKLTRLRFLRLMKTRGLVLEELLPIFDTTSIEEFFLGAGYILPNLLPFAKLTSLTTFVTPCQILDQDFSILFRLKKLRQARFIGLENFSQSDDELQNLAKKSGRKLTIEVIGRGKKQQTVIFNLA